jgi:hypothetical protein
LPAPFSLISDNLVDVPEKRERPLRDAGDVLSPGLMLQIHPEGRVDRVVERGLVQPARGRLFVIERPGVVPRRNLGFDLRNVRPPEERLVAIGTNDLAGRIDAVDAIVLLSQKVAVSTPVESVFVEIHISLGTEMPTN